MELEAPRIPDPLTDTFLLEDLPRVSPWIAEEIAAVGPDEIADELASMKMDIHHSLPMTAWVSAVSRCHSDLWSALSRG